MQIIAKIIEKIGLSIALGSTNASMILVNDEPVMPKHMLNK